MIKKICTISLRYKGNASFLLTMIPATTEPIIVPSNVKRPLKPAVTPRCCVGTLSAMIALHGEFARLLLNCKSRNKSASMNRRMPEGSAGEKAKAVSATTSHAERSVIGNGANKWVDNDRHKGSPGDN